MAANQNTLPDQNQAYNTLYQGIHQQIFFRKCAQAGLVPRTEGEALAMLETAGKLQAVAQTEQVKSAEEANSPFHQMNAALDSVLTKYGLDAGAPAHQEVDLGFRQAAAALAEDANFYNSVISLKAAEAEEIRQQLTPR